MTNEREVRALLNSIIDPCSAAAGAPAGLDDMGLVRAVSFEPTAGAGVQLTVVIAVTEYGCLLGAAFAHSAYEKLVGLVGVEAVTVNLDSRFDWVPSDMSEAYVARLAAHRNAVRPAAARVWPIKQEAIASHIGDM